MSDRAALSQAGLHVAETAAPCWDSTAVVATPNMLLRWPPVSSTPGAAPCCA